MFARAREFRGCELETSPCLRDLGRAFVEFDLIWGRINDEQKSASLNDIAILESDISELPTDLRSQLYLVHGRELSKELKPPV
jgi:hypothetical protein